MNSELKIFENEEFGRIRSVMVNNEPYFVGKDIAEALGYTNSRKAIQDHVDEDDKLDGVTIRDAIGRNQLAVVINESGIYALIFGSKLPNAKRFKHWVTSEVLPSIRKHGAYMTEQRIEEIILNPDTVIKLAQELKTEREEKRKLAEKVEFDEPKVTFANSVISSKSSILIRELAKLLKQNHIDMGQNKLYEWLREKGYIIKGSTEPTQRAMNLGVFEVEENTYLVKGESKISFTTKCTPKGQIYFINKLTKERDYARG